MTTDFSLIKSFYKQMVPELQDASWMELQNMFTVRHLRKGDYVSKVGEVVKQVTFFNSGYGRFYYNVDGKESIGAFFQKGDYICDYESFLTQKPGLVNIDVLADSELIELSYDNMQYSYRNFPEFQKFGRVMAEFLFLMLSSRNASLLLKTPEQRYLDFVANSPHLLQLVPQYMIASYLGVTPEALSRIRKRLSS